jgi:hypothetical protein
VTNLVALQAIEKDFRHDASVVRALDGVSIDVRT